MDPNSMDFIPQTMEIKVLWQGAIFPLRILISARIIEVKQQIYELLNIPIIAERQELSWEAQFLTDQRTVQNYDIPPNATLTVYKKIQVRIYMGIHGSYYDLVVYQGITVGELKAKLQTDKGVNIEHKRLRLDRLDQLDERVHLRSYGIGEGTSLYLV